MDNRRHSFNLDSDISLIFITKKKIAYFSSPLLIHLNPFTMLRLGTRDNIPIWPSVPGIHVEIQTVIEIGGGGRGRVVTGRLPSRGQVMTIMESMGVQATLAAAEMEIITKKNLLSQSVVRIDVRVTWMLPQEEATGRGDHLLHTTETVGVGAGRTSPATPSTPGPWPPELGGRRIIVLILLDLVVNTVNASKIPINSTGEGEVVCWWMEQDPRLASTRAGAMAGAAVGQIELTPLLVIASVTVIQVWMLVAFQVSSC